MKIFLILTAIFLSSCHSLVNEKPAAPTDGALLYQTVIEITKVMVHDVTNPPLAARFFAYSMLAGYTAVSPNEHNEIGLDTVDTTQLKAQIGEEHNRVPELASLLSIVETAMVMQPSGYLLMDYKEVLKKKFRSLGYDETVIENSQKYALRVSNKILELAKADGYSKISDYARYTPVEQEGYWFPTPPAFFAAIEPHFGTLKTFFIDSAAQFKTDAPVPFSTKKTSPFFSSLKEVYDIGKNLNDDQREIAMFWDCNPFAMQDQGHLMIGIKKISPGAHWMGIAGIACDKNKVSFQKAIEIHAVLAMSMMDAFIACWDEKFRSNRIRPETAIRKYLDEDWTPLLQTPPFPEYVSGHSVVSATSAEVLTYFFGENFSFSDSVEVNYGLPPRKFESFRAASEEAGISRVYGGIHFMDAVVNGQKQGIQIGNYIVNKLPARHGVQKQ